MIPHDVFARYAAMRVPRYTSYPTAPQFSAAIGPSEYKRWLASLPERSEVSLYLHLPFCRQMCWYCGCHTSVANRRGPVARYVDSLLAEIELIGSALKARPRVGHLHWGGGSPTLLTAPDIEAIHSALSRILALDPLAENAVEVDPRTLTAAQAAAFARTGVNRASVGVQSFDPTVQAAINRVQEFETVANAVTTLRDNGVPAINLDLMYGLPFQDVRSCIETAEKSLRLQPDRFAVFGYAHVPSFKPHQRKIDEAALAGPDERQAQAQAIAEVLASAGYRRIGLDHFALAGDSLALAAESGTLRRNFQGYTTDRCRALIGLGASAIGKFPSGFVQNATRIPDYERRIASGRLATARGGAISADDARRAAIIEQLMCNYRAQVGAVDAPLDRLAADGLIRRSGSWIEVTDEARPLIRSIAAAFDAYLPASNATHVTAI